MSKAYDRVNIFMLKKALERIKILNLFINIIMELFTGRKNRVFTPYKLTDEYNVKVGIDQGEIISLILWCIYYPLLNKIRNKGFKLATEKKIDI